MEVVLEPGALPPDVPAFIGAPVIVGRRLLAPLEEAAAPAAIEWVSQFVRSGIAEEYELGAVSREDMYVRLLGPGALTDGHEEAEGLADAVSAG